jgi:hypothetical protein
MKRLVVLNDAEPENFLFRDPSSPFLMGGDSGFAVFAKEAKKMLDAAQTATANAAFEVAGPDLGPALKLLSTQIAALQSKQDLPHSSPIVAQTAFHQPPPQPLPPPQPQLSTSWDQPAAQSTLRTPATTSTITTVQTARAEGSHAPSSAVTPFARSMLTTTSTSKADGKGYYNAPSRNVPNLDTFKSVRDIHTIWFFAQGTLPSFETLETLPEYKFWRKKCAPSLATRLCRLKKVMKTLEVIANEGIFANNSLQAAVALDVEFKSGFFVSTGSGMASFFDWLWKGSTQRANYRSDSNPLAQRVSDDIHRKLADEAAVQKGKRKNELQVQSEAKRQRQQAKQNARGDAPASVQVGTNPAQPIQTTAAVSSVVPED